MRSEKGGNSPLPILCIICGLPLCSTAVLVQPGRPHRHTETVNEVVLPLSQGRISGPVMGGFLQSEPLGRPRAMKTVGQLPQVGVCECRVGLARGLSYLSVWGAVPWLPSIIPVFRADPMIFP